MTRKSRRRKAKEKVQNIIRFSIRISINDKIHENQKVMTQNLRNSLQMFIFSYMFEPFPKPKFLFVNIIITSGKKYLKAM